MVCMKITTIHLYKLFIYPLQFLPHTLKIITILAYSSPYYIFSYFVISILSLYFFENTRNVTTDIISNKAAISQPIENQLKLIKKLIIV